MAVKPILLLVASLLLASTRALNAAAAVDEVLLEGAKVPPPAPKIPVPTPPVKPPVVAPVAPPPKPPVAAPTPPKAPVLPPNPPARTTLECGKQCEGRCGLHSRKNVCMRACMTCCERCKCVPPGTYGNQEMCGKCYTDMRTHGNRVKCP